MKLTTVALSAAASAVGLMESKSYAFLPPSSLMGRPVRSGEAAPTATHGAGTATMALKGLAKKV